MESLNPNIVVNCNFKPVLVATQDEEIKKKSKKKSKRDGKTKKKRAKQDSKTEEGTLGDYDLL